MKLTWNIIKNLSSSLYDELQKSIKEKFYNLINTDAALILISNSSKLNYLITNFKSLKNAEQQFVEEFNNLLKKEIKTEILSNDLTLITRFLNLFENQFKNQQNLYLGLNVLDNFFNDLELYPEFDLFIKIYDNFKLIQQNIENIALQNIESIKDGTFAFSTTNNLLASFIDVYCLKNDIVIELETENKEEKLPNKKPKNQKNLNNPDNNFSTYQVDLVSQIMSEARQYKLLEQTEIRELIEKAQNGSKYAEEKIIKHNQRLVINILKRYLYSNVGFLDLYQEGSIGLSKAIRKFDLSKGFAFSTYATWWVRQAITRAVAEQSRNIKIPVHIMEKLNRYRITRNKLLIELGDEPTPKELANAMNCSETEILDIIRISQDTISYNITATDDEKNELLDIISSNDNIEEEYENNAIEDSLIDFFKTLHLTEKEMYIALHRFNLEGYPKKTLREIAEKFHLTHERIRQIEEKVRKKIFLSTKIKTFCQLFSAPDLVYQYAIEYRNRFYNRRLDNTKTSANKRKNYASRKSLTTRVGVDKDTLAELITKLNPNDQAFISQFYDSDFEPNNSNLTDKDYTNISNIVFKLQKISRNPDYRPRENLYQNLCTVTGLSAELLNILLINFSNNDQNLISDLYNENFELKISIIPYEQKCILQRIIENLKILEKNPDFDPKEQTNLCKILNTTIEDLEEVVSLLSFDLQKFLSKLYDENWDEKKIPNKSEKKILKKVIKLLKQLILDTKKPNNLTNNNLNHTIKLNDLELIIVMGLISEENYDVNFIADFLQLPKEVVIETISNQFINCQKRHSLIREKK